LDSPGVRDRERNGRANLSARRTNVQRGALSWREWLEYRSKGAPDRGHRRVLGSRHAPKARARDLDARGAGASLADLREA